MIAAIGRQLKQSVNVFHSLMLYRLLPRIIKQKKSGKKQNKEEEKVKKKDKLAFIVEAIDSIDASALVVTTKQEEIFRILDFVCEQETNSFERLLATIHIIAKEEIVCFGRKATVLEEPEKISILAMNVTADFQRCLKLKQNWLAEKDFTRLET